MSKQSPRDIFPQRTMELFYLLKSNAARMLQKAVEANILPRLKNSGIKCADCGAPAKGYDRRDYFEPLKVEPVCHTCNLRRGSALKTFDKIAWRKYAKTQL